MFGCAQSLRERDEWDEGQFGRYPCPFDEDDEDALIFAMAMKTLEALQPAAYAVLLSGLSTAEQHASLTSIFEDAAKAHAQKRAEKMAASGYDFSAALAAPQTFNFTASP
jgi:hypothetical protein